MDKDTTTIVVEKKTRNKLVKFKYDIEADNIDEVINRILEIVPANKLVIKDANNN